MPGGNGHFDQLDLQVELVLVKSARERDTLMQTRQVDRTLQNAGVPPAQIVLQELQRWIPDFAATAQNLCGNSSSLMSMWRGCLPYASPFWREWPDH